MKITKNGFREMAIHARGVIQGISSRPLLEFDDPAQAAHVLAAVDRVLDDLVVRHEGKKAFIVRDVRKLSDKLVELLQEDDSVRADRLLHHLSDELRELDDKFVHVMQVLTACKDAYHSGRFSAVTVVAQTNSVE